MGQTPQHLFDFEPFDFLRPGLQRDNRGSDFQRLEPLLDGTDLLDDHMLGPLGFLHALATIPLHP